MLMVTTFHHRPHLKDTPPTEIQMPKSKLNSNAIQFKPNNNYNRAAAKCSLDNETRLQLFECALSNKCTFSAKC